MKEFLLAVISTNRPGNVQFIQSLCAPRMCVWFVNDGEKQAYLKAGAQIVYESGTNICEARNAAIRMSEDVPCIQISDDLKSIKKISLGPDGKRVTQFITVEFVCNLMITELEKHNAFFGGVAVTNNPLNYDGKDLSTNKLIVNDFICMMPGKYLFDETLALKEDYDMCVQQLIDGHKIIRLNNILCDFPHRQNAGGANVYRDDTTEGAATAALMAKWPKYIMPHKTRAGQVSLNYPAIEKRIKGVEPGNLFGF